MKINHNTYRCTVTKNELLLTFIIYFGKSSGMTFCMVTFSALSGIHALQTLGNAEKHVVTCHQVYITLPCMRTATVPSKIKTK